MKRLHRVYLREITLTDLYLQYRLSRDTWTHGYLCLARIYLHIYLTQTFVQIEDWFQALSSLTSRTYSDSTVRSSPVVGVQQSETEISRAATWKREREQVREQVREREGGRGSERGRGRVRKRRERSSRVERKGEEGSTQKERGEATENREDGRPMRHQAGDDVVVVSRSSLTKSLLRVPVRSRSPGWTRRSSFPHHSSLFLFVSFLVQWIQIQPRLHPGYAEGLRRKEAAAVSHGDG